MEDPRSSMEVHLHLQNCRECDCGYKVTNVIRYCIGNILKDSGLFGGATQIAS
jgi:hypothetical protein